MDSSIQMKLKTRSRRIRANREFFIRSKTSHDEKDCWVRSPSEPKASKSTTWFFLPTDLEYLVSRKSSWGIIVWSSRPFVPYFPIPEHMWRELLRLTEDYIYRDTIILKSLQFAHAIDQCVERVLKRRIFWEEVNVSVAKEAAGRKSIRSYSPRRNRTICRN